MFTVRKREVPWEVVGSTWKLAVALRWIKANAVFLFIPSFSSPSTSMLAIKLKVAL